MHVTNYSLVVLTHSGQTCWYFTPSSPTLGTKEDCHGLAPAGNKEPCSCPFTLHSHPHPLVGWRGESEGKGKTCGLEQKQLTEQQREKKKKTKILITRRYSMQCSHSPMLSLLLSSKSPYSSQLPNLNTEHDVTRCRISHSTVWFGSALLASCEN